MGRQDSDKWLQAAKEGFASLISNNTWNLVEPPHYQKALPGKWVVKYKTGISEKILRYKARWVAKGYEQQFGKSTPPHSGHLAYYTAVSTFVL